VAGVTQLGLWRYLRSGFLPAAVVGAILMVFGIGLNWLARPQSWQALAICAVMVGLVWLALTWLIGLDSEDRRRIIRLARRSRDPKPVAEPTAASATQSSCDSSASM
jgi:predicted permease